MSNYVLCAVGGCDDRKSSRHRFPNPEKNKSRFDTCISLIANSKLVNLQPLEVYRNYRVCHQHFTMDDKSSNMYLKRTAVPLQKLPINAVLSAHDQLLSKIPVPSTSFQSFSPLFASESDEVIPTVQSSILLRSNVTPTFGNYALTHLDFTLTRECGIECLRERSGDVTIHFYYENHSFVRQLHYYHPHDAVFAVMESSHSCQWPLSGGLLYLTAKQVPSLGTADGRPKTILFTFAFLATPPCTNEAKIWLQLIVDVDSDPVQLVVQTPTEAPESQPQISNRTL
ncbi:hypothetical protein FQA39_LY10037 [Lamprigera yunnana]|nr:hypothetical protein FQA39_LY10037 [Lamprigera yunnana]